ncbi:MAG: flagellar export chaperone FlgN [Candidatus Kapabacteria bacterium]|nr:flagellar export chaperone FlgN [Candidatus Kapabacteria bacterium]
MLETFYKILKHELQLLDKLINLAENQQESLVKYQHSRLFEIASAQELLMKQMRLAEENRISFMIKWLNIQRKDASEIKLSNLEKAIPAADLNVFHQLQDALKKSIEKLNFLNTLNRVLANRARYSVQQIISIFTNGNNHVCNVKV